MDLHSHIGMGDSLPAFRATSLEGTEIDSGNRSKGLFWLYFFIIKCPFCRESMRFIQEELTKAKDPPFEFLAVGREHTREELIRFRNDQGFSFPMAADPGRKIYEMFATGKVPRTYLAGKDGRILLSSRGYNPEEYRKIFETALGHGSVTG